MAVVLGYVTLGLIAGFVGFVVVLGLGASLWTALLMYSLVGTISTLLPALFVGAFGSTRARRQPLAPRMPGQDLLDVPVPLPEIEPAGASVATTVADMHILAVDDDPFILELIPKIAAKAGCSDVTTADSGSRALELIRRAARPFDCILLDINMPEMDGIDLCTRIRRLPAYRDNPIIMLTAMTDMDHLDRAFRAGASDYTAKPFDIIEFGDRLQVARTQIAVRPNAGADVTAMQDTVRLVPLAGVPALIQPAALGNYLARLSGSALSEAYVMSVAIDRLAGNDGDEAPDAFLTILSEVALAVDWVIGPQSYVMAHVARGCFVIVVSAVSLPGAAEIEAAIQQRIDRQRVRAKKKSGRRITISAGLAVRPRSAKADRARIAFESAMALAKQRVADKQGDAVSPVHRSSGH